MNNDLGLLVKNIPQDELSQFIKGTSARTEVRKSVNKVVLDYSWVDILSEAVPYLDTIIRNPRRFIVQEEDIVPIEKTKKVSEESIKHLAVHTNLIQDVDEDGSVKPLKLLNVFKEETIDLYENRFVYSLIMNLYTFVRERLTYREQSFSNKEEKSVVYEGKTLYKNQEININLNMVSRNKNEEELSEELQAEREAKINGIMDILEEFMSSKFMKAMANATPVRSPIRKTNVILKEQNFMKALELWEFLENYQVEKPVKEEQEEAVITNEEFEKGFGLTYYLNYGVLNEVVSTNGKDLMPETFNLQKSIFELAKKFDVDELDLQKKLNAEIEKAINYKSEQRSLASSGYKNFIANHKARMKKAVILFK